MHRKPTTKSHIFKEKEEQCRAKKSHKLMSPVKLPISRSTCLKISPGLSPTSFLKSPILLSNIKVWSCSLSLSLMPYKKNPKECIANPNHKYSKPKLRIHRSETQITKLDIEMNRFGLSLN